MNEITRYLVEQLRQRNAALPEQGLGELDYIEHGYIDSMGVIKFVLDIEQTYSIEVSEDDLQSDAFRTINGLAALIADKLGRRHD
ncbi:MAG: acyl carrier protein [Alcaligenes aquatilis]